MRARRGRERPDLAGAEICGVDLRLAAAPVLPYDDLAGYRGLRLVGRIDDDGDLTACAQIIGVDVALVGIGPVVGPDYERPIDPGLRLPAWYGGEDARRTR